MTLNSDDVKPIDLNSTKIKLLEQRVERLEKTVKRMDKLLCAMNHRQTSEMERGFGMTPDWRDHK